MATKTVAVDATFVASPVASDTIGTGHTAIKNTRVAYKEVVAEEHYLDPAGTTSAHGRHLEGSAICYVEESAPTKRPNGSDALTADDNGRLWYKESTAEYSIYVHGTGWVLIGNQITAALATAINDESRLPTAASVTALQDALSVGSWTPTLEGSTTAGGATHSAVRSGWFVKFGPLVFISFAVQITAKNTMAGNVYLTGLPYTAKDSTKYNSGGVNLKEAYGITPDSGYTQLLPAIQENTKFLTFRQFGSGKTSSPALTVSGIANSTTIIGNGFYMTDE